MLGTGDDALGTGNHDTDKEVPARAVGIRDAECSVLSVDCVLPSIVSQVVPALEAQWTLERMLGSGAQGAVWAARNQVDQTWSVAVKLAKAGDAAREVAAYRRLCLFEMHPNLLEFHFAYYDRQQKRANRK